MNCPNCNSKDFYTLANNYIKCKKCAKKISLNRYKQKLEIIKSFCENKTANETASFLDKNYKTVKKQYDEIRLFIAKYAEEIYLNSVKDNSQYEEYYYFPLRDKYKKSKSIYKAINIIGFYSNEKVYTLLMPKLQYKTLNKDDTFEQYLNWHKIQSRESHRTKLYDFWKYLEENLKKYKGVNEENFFYYLKECEFKFNYTIQEQEEILQTLYLSNHS